jgi:hypothetical protein
VVAAASAAMPGQPAAAAMLPVAARGRPPGPAARPARGWWQPAAGVCVHLRSRPAAATRC